MNYTVPYHGTFCSTKKILKKRVPSKEATEIRNYCLSHPLSASKSPDGKIVFNIQDQSGK